MAVFYTDFSEYTAGAPPSDWSTNATISGTDLVSWNVVADGVGQVLRIVSGTVQQRRAFWWDDVPHAADVEILYKARIGSGSGDSYLQQHVRHNGAAAGSDVTYMSTQLSATQRELFLINAPAATFTQLAVGTANVANDTVYWFRTAITGTLLRTRFWADGTAEPHEWLLTATNGSIAAAGRAAVGLSHPNRTQDILAFGVGTDGDSAPGATGVPVGKDAYDLWPGRGPYTQRRSFRQQPELATTFAPNDDYSELVNHDRPVRYYRLGHAVGSVATREEIVGAHGQLAAAGISSGQPSLIYGSADTATQFNTAGYYRLPAVDIYNRSFAVEAWVQVPAGRGSTGMVFGHHTAAAANQGLHLAVGADGSVQFNYYSDDLSTAAGEVADDTPTHLVWVYDAEFDTSLIYVNGVSVVAAGQGPYNGSDSAVVQIGAWDSGQPFNGVIDELAIYDYRLTASQILAHYDLGTEPVVGVSGTGATAEETAEQASGSKLGTGTAASAEASQEQASGTAIATSTAAEAAASQEQASGAKVGTSTGAEQAATQEQASGTMVATSAVADQASSQETSTGAAVLAVPGSAVVEQAETQEQASGAKVGTSTAATANASQEQVTGAKVGTSLVAEAGTSQETSAGTKVALGTAVEQGSSSETSTGAVSTTPTSTGAEATQSQETSTGTARATSVVAEAVASQETSAGTKVASGTGATAVASEETSAGALALPASVIVEGAGAWRPVVAAAGSWQAVTASEGAWQDAAAALARGSWQAVTASQGATRVLVAAGGTLQAVVRGEGAV